MNIQKLDPLTLRKLNQSDDILARILAQEGLRVVYNTKMHTAAFDLKRRLIMLPLWKVNKILRIMIRVHEVAHALYTPEAGWHGALDKKKNKYPQVKNIRRFASYLNVVEDTRIERLISKKYPGLARILAMGHQELFKLNFYSMQKPSDANTRPFIDRALLYFRLGKPQSIKFQKGTVEMDFLHRMDTVETWEEVEKLALEIYEYQATQPTIEFELMMPPMASDGDGEGEDMDELEEIEADGDEQASGEMKQKSKKKKKKDKKEEDSADEDGDSADGEGSSEEDDESGDGDSDEDADGDGEGDTEGDSDESKEDSKEKNASNRDAGSNDKRDPEEDKIPETLDEKFREQEDKFGEQQSGSNAFDSTTAVVATHNRQSLRKIVTPLDEFYKGLD